MISAAQQAAASPVSRLDNVQIGWDYSSVVSTSWG
jgi:hypothetical protein